jgi:phosphinothricin acetyltransferase
MRDTFAYMDGLVDPPSSIQRMTLLSLKSHAQTAELWTLGRPLEACAILTPKPHALYIGKLCVMPKVRGLGLSRRLVEHASQRAKALDLPVLELETRIELVANHAAFKAMGFVEIGRTAHAGFAEPTAITFQRAVSD